MKNIFVFTASNPVAKSHMRDTIENPIPNEKVEQHFTDDELDRVREIGDKYGYYAWGATPGPSNIRNWEAMQIGDHVLIYQNKLYTFYSKLAFKAHNPHFANNNWGTDNEGHTWEYMYLLEKPAKVDPPIEAAKLSQHLPASYMGFSRISDERVRQIINNHGSIDSYLEKELLLRSIDNQTLNFWWVCQGNSYTEDRGQKFIWAPKKNKNGKAQHHWENVRNVKERDIVINYANGFVRGISITVNGGYDFINEEEDKYEKDGTRVDIRHFKIDDISHSRLKVKKTAFRNVLNELRGPFDINGNINKGYLFEFNYEAAKILREIYGKPFPEEIEKYFIGVIPMAKTDFNDEMINLLNSKKQIILYGPPGTGKTYSTRKVTVNLLNELSRK